jgi:hypothetical protein
VARALTCHTPVTVVVVVRSYVYAYTSKLLATSTTQLTASNGILADPFTGHFKRYENEPDYTCLPGRLPSFAHDKVHERAQGELYC